MYSLFDPQFMLYLTKQYEYDFVKKIEETILNRDVENRIELIKTNLEKMLNEINSTTEQIKRKIDYQVKPKYQSILEKANNNVKHYDLKDFINPKLLTIKKEFHWSKIYKDLSLYIEYHPHDYNECRHLGISYSKGLDIDETINENLIEIVEFDLVYSAEHTITPDEEKRIIYEKNHKELLKNYKYTVNRIYNVKLFIEIKNNMGVLKIKDVKYRIETGDNTDYRTINSTITRMLKSKSQRATESLLNIDNNVEFVGKVFLVNNHAITVLIHPTHNTNNQFVIRHNINKLYVKDEKYNINNEYVELSNIHNTECIKLDKILDDSELNALPKHDISYVFENFPNKLYIDKENKKMYLSDYTSGSNSSHISNVDLSTLNIPFDYTDDILVKSVSPYYINDLNSENITHIPLMIISNKKDKIFITDKKNSEHWKIYRGGKYTNTTAIGKGIVIPCLQDNGDCVLVGLNVFQNNIQLEDKIIFRNKYGSEGSVVADIISGIYGGGDYNETKNSQFGVCAISYDNYDQMLKIYMFKDADTFSEDFNYGKYIHSSIKIKELENKKIEEIVINRSNFGYLTVSLIYTKDGHKLSQLYFVEFDYDKESVLYVNRFDELNSDKLLGDIENYNLGRSIGRFYLKPLTNKNNSNICISNFYNTSGATYGYDKYSQKLYNMHFKTYFDISPVHYFEFYENNLKQLEFGKIYDIYEKQYSDGCVVFITSNGIFVLDKTNRLHVIIYKDKEFIHNGMDMSGITEIPVIYRRKNGIDDTNEKYEKYLNKQKLKFRFENKYFILNLERLGSMWLREQDNKLFNTNNKHEKYSDVYKTSTIEKIYMTVHKDLLSKNQGVYKTYINDELPLNPETIMFGADTSFVIKPGDNAVVSYYNFYKNASQSNDIEFSKNPIEFKIDGDFWDLFIHKKGSEYINTFQEKIFNYFRNIGINSDTIISSNDDHNYFEVDFYYFLEDTYSENIIYLRMKDFINTKILNEKYNTKMALYFHNEPLTYETLYIESLLKNTIFKKSDKELYGNYQFGRVRPYTTLSNVYVIDKHKHYKNSIESSEIEYNKTDKYYSLLNVLNFTRYRDKTIECNINDATHYNIKELSKYRYSKISCHVRINNVIIRNIFKDIRCREWNYFNLETSENNATYVNFKTIYNKKLLTRKKHNVHNVSTITEFTDTYMNNKITPGKNKQILIIQFMNNYTTDINNFKLASKYLFPSGYNPTMYNAYYGYHGQYSNIHTLDNQDHNNYLTHSYYDWINDHSYLSFQINAHNNGF